MLSPKDVSILQVVPHLDSGGAERTTLEICQALTAVGAAAVTVTEGGRLAESIRECGGEVVELPVASKNPLQIAANALALRKLIRQRGISLVHARSRAPAISALWASRSERCSFVTTYHSTYSNAGFAPLRSLKNSYNGVMARGDRVIANSQLVANLVRSRHAPLEDRLRLIYRGLDLETFSPDRVNVERLKTLRGIWKVPNNRRVVMFPSRISQAKGQLVAIEALARLKAAVRDGLVLVLPGPELASFDYVDKLRARISDLGLTNHVAFVPECSDMPAAYSLADVTIAGSMVRPEAFGRTAIEAQGMGSLVIANRDGATAETVVGFIGEGDGAYTGWLVPPNDPASLASALERSLLVTAEERESVLRRALINVERHFTADRMRLQTLAIYDELLGTDLAVTYQTLLSSSQN